MKITKENKSNYFLEESGFKHYAKGKPTVIERFGKDFIRFLKEKQFETGKILDMGSGTGYMAVMLSEAFPKAEIVGIDYSELMINHAGNFVNRSGKSDKISFIKGNITKMPFADKWFDAIVSLNTLHYSEDMTDTLNEVQRVLKNSGLVAISDIRNCFMSLFLPPFKVTYPYTKFKSAFEASELRNCTLREKLFWIDIRSFNVNIHQ